MDSRIEQTCVEHEWAVEPRRERIDQQFGAIETMPALRLEAAVRAQAVTGAGSDARDMTVKNIAQPARQLHARRLAPSRVEKRNKYRLGAARRDGKIDPAPVRGGTKRLGLASTDARIAQYTGQRSASGAQVITDGASRPV
jgi:hypothetical protein